MAKLHEFPLNLMSTRYFKEYVHKYIVLKFHDEKSI